MRKAILFAGVLILLVIPSMMGCHKNGSFDYKVIEAEAKHELPIGTSRAIVDLYLTNRKIGHTFYKPENRIYALIPDTGTHTFGFSKSLSIIFSFDTNSSLTNINCKTNYTGP